MGREAKWNGGQVLGPERKPEEVGLFPLDLDIVHFTGEVAVVNLGSPVIVQAALARTAPPRASTCHVRRVPTVCWCLR